jgi:hypothetical protein
MSNKDIKLKIIDVERSSNHDKRFKICLNDGKTYHFGLKDGHTFIDHQDKKIRSAYRARHYPLEKRLIDNLEPSPALFSYYILWGPYTSLDKNVNYLNGLFKRK